MTAERTARLLVLVVLAGIPLAFLVALRAGGGGETEVHARVAEAGGWVPADLTIAAGRPLRLRLTSDDVLHGFAVGQTDWPEVEVRPGQVAETVLTFERPGKYTFYCTRWCGLNHWRMRGTIEVTGAAADSPAVPPLYVSLGLDIDAPHPAAAVPLGKPSAARGARLAASLPPEFLEAAYYRAHSPEQAWKELRIRLPGSPADADVWDAVAYTWAANAAPGALAEGRQLYAANCAACHGESGGGDGVMAEALAGASHAEHGLEAPAPARFDDPVSMLGVSPAALQGKIVRGGMGTNMPYWGPIFTEAQTWALVSYLWTFQFGDMESLP